MFTTLNLIAALRQVEANNDIKEIVPDSIKDEEGSYSSSDMHPDVLLVIAIADQVLITKDGRCDLFSMDIVKRAGFDIYAGEKDSFGWLTGVIKTTKGEIVYG